MSSSEEGAGARADWTYSSSRDSVLEIAEAGENCVTTFVLTGSRQLIGRTPDVPICLDNDGVSRLHAAMIRDPYDRWWIHDLESTNGTHVNGTAVSQRLLNPGDTICIGPFTLTLKVPGDPLAAEQVRPSTARPGPMQVLASTKRLPAVTTVRLTAELTREAIGFARSLSRIEDEQLRLVSLCDHVVKQAIPGLWACAVRMAYDGSLAQLCAPATRSTSGVLGPTPQVLQALCWEHRETLLREAGPHAFGYQQGVAGELVVCTLRLFPNSVDLLFVQLGANCDPKDWTALLALLADSWASASEFWQNRQLLAVNAGIERELQMAQQLQDSLIKRKPEAANLDLAIGYHPSRWVGGDYVDAIQMPDGRMLTIVADVCGKGFQAALVASSLHALAHVLVQVCDSVSEVATHMHAYVSSYLPIDSFVTMVCVALNVETREIECLNLGHPAPLLVRDDGTVQPLQCSQNSALGLLTCAPQSELYTMGHNDVLLLYTDGMTELRIPTTTTSSGLFQMPDTALLAGALDACVDIIRSMAGAEIDKMRDCISESLKIQLDLAMASDDATFLLARLAGGGNRPWQRSTPPPPRTVGRRLSGDYFGAGARPQYF
jgi:serine phosphatase RsbU (regulator of sigma subunit)